MNFTPANPAETDPARVSFSADLSQGRQPLKTLPVGQERLSHSEQELDERFAFFNSDYALRMARGEVA